MYFYIFDIKKCRKKSQVEDIKSYLSMLGISGEFTYPSSAQSCEELVDLGLSKKYSTIITIGGDEIANQVAGKLCGRNEAMGIIPLDASPHLETLVGTGNWKEACDNLRFRKISEIPIGRTGNGKSFLTNASLDLVHPVELTIEFKDYLVTGVFKNVVFSNFHKDIPKVYGAYLDIAVESVDETSQGFLNRLSKIFKVEQTTQKNVSIFRARSLRAFAKRAIPIKAGNEIISKTPEYIESSDEKLRIITAKKIGEE